MRAIFPCLAAVAVLLSSAAAVRADSSRNVLLICIDDLRPELGCYGVDYIHSPNIDKLAARGRIFDRHYVQAPTCGASRYALLTGRYGPAGNDALFQRARNVKSDPEAVIPSMPEWFRQRGYTTVSVGKVSHHPGGRGGDRWNDDSIPEMPGAWDRHLLPAGPWQDPRGWMHGLANGEIRIDGRKRVTMKVLQAVDGPDTIYPDGVSMKESLRQLQELSSGEKPFFLAVGLLRPHLPFGAPARYLKPYMQVRLPAIPHPTKPEGRTTWHGSGEFMKYDRDGRNPNTDAEYATIVRKHYAACVSYADAQVGRLMAALEKSGAADKTVVVLWGDHGWHLGEHGIWGKHALFEESLRSPLIVATPDKLPAPGKRTDAVVESIDVFPTLCELAGVAVPAFAQGRSLVPMLQSPDAAGDLAISYRSKARTIRSSTHRLILHADGFVELYDHRTAAGETKNIAAADPETTQRLIGWLNEALPEIPSGK